MSPLKSISPVMSDHLFLYYFEPNTKGTDNNQ